MKALAGCKDANNGANSKLSARILFNGQEVSHNKKNTPLLHNIMLYMSVCEFVYDLGQGRNVALFHLHF